VARMSADTGRPQRAGVAESGSETKGPQRRVRSPVALARPDRDDGLTDVPRRTGADQGLQINLEVVLGEKGLVAPLGDLRIQSALRVGKLLASLAIAEGTIPDRLCDLHVRIPLRLLDDFQGLLAVLGIPGRDRRFADQLARGVDGDDLLGPVEASRRALASVPHLGIVDRHDPVGAYSVVKNRSVRAPLDVLQQDLRRQACRFDQAGSPAIGGWEVGECGPRHVREPIRVGADLLQEGLAGPGIVLIDRGVAFPAGSDVAADGVGDSVLLRRHPDLRGRGPDQLDDPLGEEVGGVPHCAAPEDGTRVQDRFDLAALEVTGPTGEGQALPEDGAHFVVDDELCPKELQGALGERTLVAATPQGDLPAQTESGARRRLLVGDRSCVWRGRTVASTLGGTLGRPLSGVESAANSSSEKSCPRWLARKPENVSRPTKSRYR
jgi:hypothetical protein